MDTLTQRTALHIKQELYFLLDTANETAKKTQYFKQLAVAERLEKHYLLHCLCLCTSGSSGIKAFNSLNWQLGH